MSGGGPPQPAPGNQLEQALHDLMTNKAAIQALAGQQALSAGQQLPPGGLPPGGLPPGGLPPGGLPPGAGGLPGMPGQLPPGMPQPGQLQGMVPTSLSQAQVNIPAFQHLLSIHKPALRTDDVF